MSRIRSNSLSTIFFERLKGEQAVFLPFVERFPAVVFSIFGLVLFVIVFWLTYDFRWSWAKVIILAILLLSASFLVVYGAITIYRRKSGRVLAGLYVTPDIAVFFDDSLADWFPLTDLVSIDCSHRHSGRKYDHSVVTVVFPGFERSFTVRNIDLAEDSVDEIERLKNKSIARSVRDDSFSSAGLIDTLMSAQKGTNRRAKLVVITITAGLAFFTLFAAVELNKYYDDTLSWKKAVEGSKASDFRDYVLGHPEGRWKAEADTRLKTIYDEAESRYRSVLGNEYDESAVGSVIALLRYAKETQQYQVNVTFERKADIPPDLVEKIKTDFEVKKVLPLGSTFSEEKMLSREEQLFLVLQAAFKQVFPDDIIEFVKSCNGECSQFVVRYETSFLDSIYYDLKEKEIPREERNWSPGILINWQFSLHVPGETSGYEFDLESAPAEQINYDSAIESESDSVTQTDQDMDQKSFYNAMVTSAFDDFKQHLLFNLGMGTEPHLEQNTQLEK